MVSRESERPSHGHFLEKNESWASVEMVLISKSISKWIQRNKSNWEIELILQDLGVSLKI